MTPQGHRTGHRTVRVAAVDIGASSGRVMAVEVGRDGIALTEAHRFANTLVERDGHLRWDVGRLRAEVIEGLRLAAAAGPVDSIGIDTWAVDYGLVDADGRLVDDPISYRDDRTIGAVASAGMDRDELYSITGIQHQRFNTVYQLVADRAHDGGDRLREARRLLMIPDLLSYELTGRAVTEVTNASTTGMLDASTRAWSPRVLAGLGIGEELLAPLVEPGTVVGQVADAVATRTGLRPGTPVIAVGSHDTASAVAAVPGLRRGTAFISSGTWSLVGIELNDPILSKASQDANFTNELGLDGTVRYLRNVMGLWMLNECRRSWEAEGLDLPLDQLCVAAAQEPVGAAIIPVDDDEFLAPGNLPQRIAAAVERTGGVAPQTPSQVARCVFDSLAIAYAKTLDQAMGLAATPIDSIHVVGGGSQNAVLCQATADATGLPVHAGPAEATVLGNALVQARALGAVDGTLTDLRDLLAAAFPTTVYLPNLTSPLARKATS